MRREWNTTSMSYSTLSDGLRQPMVFSHNNLPHFTPNLSRDKPSDRSVSRSRGKRLISYQELDRSIKIVPTKMPESLSSSQLTSGGFK